MTGSLLALTQRWPPERLNTLRHMGAVAAKLNIPLYLVGGAVRDLLLGREVVDWDISCEGDPEQLAAALGPQFRTEKHSLFDTLTLIAAEGSRWDVARCRQEQYPYPAALPQIAPASLQQDLARRDYRINAMAMDLGPGHFGDLIDPWQGQADLGQRRLSILHPDSFRDDPSRIFRGLRFALRLGFQLSPDTERAKNIAIAAGHVADLSGSRCFREIRQTMALPNPAHVLQTLTAWGLGDCIPGADCPDNAEAVASWPTLILELATALKADEEIPSVEGLLLLLGSYAPSTLVENAWRYWQWPAAPSYLALLPSIAAKDTDHTGRRAPAERARYWHRWPLAGMLALLARARSPSLTHSALHFLRVQRHQTLPVSGRDLQGWGMAPGPELGNWLQRLQDARWNGEIQSKDDAHQWMKDHGWNPGPRSAG